VRIVAWSRHGGGAAIQLRSGAGRLPRPRWSVSRLHVVRGNPVLVRGQLLAGPIRVCVYLRHLSDSVLRPFLAHARIAFVPVQSRPLRGRQIGPHV